MLWLVKSASMFDKPPSCIRGHLYPFGLEVRTWNVEAILHAAGKRLPRLFFE